MRNLVVVHFADGKILKGTSIDFAPARPSFHLEAEGSGDVVVVEIADLKAVFFGKSLIGEYRRFDDPDAERVGYGKRIKVDFRDGETIYGYTSGYAPNRPAFFMFPADAESNNEKIFVVASATTDIQFV